ncbi:IS4 family transposase [Anabaena sp. PCC 7938]|uniref:IS4 family transposase n=1 Tax=Anabaena sp. PCC 7938 TaxID=1296340 RepID=UPI003BEED4A0
MPNRVKILKEKFSQSVGLPFAELLPESVINESIQELNLKYHQRIFSPVVRIWAFLSQVLDVDKSCQNIVSRVIAWLSTTGAELPSTNTSAYCQARERLPEKLLSKLFSKIGMGLEEKVSQQQLWCGRSVKIIDGSTVSMPDTKSLQEEYPQQKSQKQGCGFPVAKICVLFSLATGAAWEVVIDKLNVHDIKLGRNLYKFLNPGDVLLGDRAFCAYGDIFCLKNQGCDVVCRKNQKRKSHPVEGEITNASDRQVIWYKPKTRPAGMSLEDYRSLPKSLVVREVTYSINIPGFRTENVTLITTLLDTNTYSLEKLAELYGLRWQVELDLRHLKTTLNMDILRCKSPAMIRKEIYVFLLAYNLLRSLMWNAGNLYGVNPLSLSLQRSRQMFINFIPTFLFGTIQIPSSLLFDFTKTAGSSVLTLST